MAANDQLPDGAVGLDSWAYVYLIHRDLDTSDKVGTDTLVLASGSCPCYNYIGHKGIPTCRVGRQPEGDNIDLLPLGWLCSRGCDHECTSTGPRLTMPKGRSIPVGMWHHFPYITKELLQDLFLAVSAFA